MSDSIVYNTMDYIHHTIVKYTPTSEEWISIAPGEGIDKKIYPNAAASLAAAIRTWTRLNRPEAAYAPYLIKEKVESAEAQWREFRDTLARQGQEICKARAEAKEPKK